MTGQNVVPSAVKPPRGGHLPPSGRPDGLPAVPAGPVPEPAYGPPSWADWRRLGVMIGLLDAMGLSERRRVLAFLVDRYGSEAAR